MYKEKIINKKCVFIFALFYDDELYMLRITILCKLFVTTTMTTSGREHTDGIFTNKKPNTYREE